MKHYLFTDNDTCEDFLVGASTLIEAWDIAKHFFANPEYIDELTEFDAENSGLDEF